MCEAVEFVGEGVAELADLDGEGEVVDVVFVEASQDGFAGGAEQDEAADALGLCVRLHLVKVPLRWDGKRARDASLAASA